MHAFVTFMWFIILNIYITTNCFPITFSLSQSFFFTYLLKKVFEKISQVQKFILIPPWFKSLLHFSSATIQRQNIFLQKFIPLSRWSPGRSPGWSPGWHSFPTLARGLPGEFHTRRLLCSGSTYVCIYGACIQSPRAPRAELKKAKTFNRELAHAYSFRALCIVT